MKSYEEFDIKNVQSLQGAGGLADTEIIQQGEGDYGVSQYIGDVF
jgi:hypothetical protein